jgi:hypothetical protein
MYIYPEPKKMFENGRMYSREVTLRAYVPPMESEENPVVEISWSFESNMETYIKLQSYREMLGKELKVKAFSGEMVVEMENPPYISVRLYIDQYESAKDVLINALYMLRREEIEYIILEAFYDIRGKVQELAE